VRIFRALKILQDTDGSLQLMCAAAQPLDSLGVFGVGPVREIKDAQHPCRAHQIANHFFGIGGGANRAK